MFGLLLGLALAVTWDFPGGSLGSARETSPGHLRAAVAGQSDQDQRNRQANWYYFAVDNASPGQTVTIDLVDLPGEYNYQPNRGAVTGDTPPVWSEDGRTWRHVTDFTYDAAAPALRLRLRPAGRRFWIAHTPPYTEENLDRLWNHAREVLTRQRIGESVGGRPLWLWTAGQGKKVVWLFFRQHSWESGSSWAGEGLIREIIEKPALREQCTWKIFPMADPDGVARGGVRFNQNGFDLNRNWDVNGVEKMPEITAQRRAIRAFLESGGQIHLLLSLHNTETAEYLEGPPEQGGPFASLAERFFRELTTTTSFAPTRPLFYAASTTTPGKPGRMTVIQGLYRDFHLPGFLMEQRISHQPRYGRRPLAEDRLRFGAELARALARTVNP